MKFSIYLPNLSRRMPPYSALWLFQVPEQILTRVKILREAKSSATDSRFKIYSVMSALISESPSLSGRRVEQKEYEAWKGGLELPPSFMADSAL